MVCLIMSNKSESHCVIGAKIAVTLQIEIYYIKVQKYIYLIH